MPRSTIYLASNSGIVSDLIENYSKNCTSSEFYTMWECIDDNSLPFTITKYVKNPDLVYISISEAQNGN
jgi:hypothetical protein